MKTRMSRRAIAAVAVSGSLVAAGAWAQGPAGPGVSAGGSFGNPSGVCGVARFADTPGGGRGPCACRFATASGATLAPLDERTTAAIQEALADEIRSEAQYARAIENGAGKPFVHIVHAEQRHAELLRALFRNRQLDIPETEPAEDAPGSDGSTAETCAAAVKAEARNVALYDRLLAAGPLPEDVKAVFEHNRWASLAHHTPAFQRCAGLAVQGDAAPRPGPGRGWGRNGWAGRGGPGPGGCCGCGLGGPR